MICPNCGKSLWFLRDFCVFCKSKLVAPPRPRSVTVIGWLAIIMGTGQMIVLYIGRHALATHYRENGAAMFSAAFLAALILISGLVLLRGMNWARWLLVLVLGCSEIWSVLAHKGRVTGLLLLGVFVYYLFRPAANEFFSGRASVKRSLPEGLEKCGECDQVFPAADMIRHGPAYVCAACKPRFMQKLSEGADEPKPAV